MTFIEPILKIVTVVWGFIKPMIWNLTYSYRSANQQLSNEISLKVQEKLKPYLDQLNALSEKPYPDLKASIDGITSESSKWQEYFNRASPWTFSGITLYIHQCCHYKTDKGELKKLEMKVDKLLDSAQYEHVLQKVITSSDVLSTLQKLFISPHVYVIKNPDGVKPCPITRLNVTSKNAELVLEWEDFLNNDIYLCHYEVFYDIFTKKFRPIRLDTTSKKQSLLVEPWKTYEVGMRAVSDAGPGEWTAPVKIFNKTVPSNPSLPQVVKVTDSSVELRISLVAAEEVLCCTVQGIGNSGLRSFTTKSGDSGTIELGGLLPSTTYRLSVKLKNDQGESREFSEEVEVRTKEKQQTLRSRLFSHSPLHLRSCSKQQVVKSSLNPTSESTSVVIKQKSVFEMSHEELCLLLDKKTGSLSTRFESKFVGVDKKDFAFLAEMCFAALIAVVSLAGSYMYILDQQRNHNYSGSTGVLVLISYAVSFVEVCAVVLVAAQILFLILFLFCSLIFLNIKTVCGPPHIHHCVVLHCVPLCHCCFQTLNFFSTVNLL